MPAALVSHTAIGSPDGNPATSPSVDTTGATLLVVGVSDDTPVSTVSDSKGNTWVQAVTETTFNGCTLWYVKNPTVGSGHTFQTVGDGKFASLFMQAFSGTDTTANVDQTNHNASLFGSTIQPNSITPSADNEVVIALASSRSQFTQTVDGGFTITDQIDQANSQHLGGGMAYLVQGAAAAANPTFAGTSAQYTGAAIATFKAAAAPAGNPWYAYRQQ